VEWIFLTRMLNGPFFALSLFRIFASKKGGRYPVYTHRRSSLFAPRKTTTFAERKATMRLHHVERIDIHDPLHVVGRLEIGGRFFDGRAKTLAIGALNLNLKAIHAPEFRERRGRGT
jgi:hypothetical protein